MSKLQGLVRPEGIGKLKKISDFIGTRTRYFRLVVSQQINLAKFNSVSQEATASVFEVENMLSKKLELQTGL
jgi:hypothetical protein